MDFINKSLFAYRKNRERFAQLSILLLLIILGVFSPTGFRSLLMLMMVYSIYAMSYGVLLGYVDQPSLGHSIYFGLGAYGMALAIINWGWGFWSALGLALLVGALGGLIIGVFAVRVSEAYHVILTVLIASVFHIVAKNLVPITGGMGGLSLSIPNIIEKPFVISTYNSFHNYILFVIFTFAVYCLLTHLVCTPLGKVWVGIRENENRMISLGYNVFYYKLSAFVLSSILTALAGAFFMVRLRYVSAEFFSFDWSVTPFIWVIIGGIGTITGPIIGVILFTVFQIYVSELWAHYLMLFGVLILLILRFLPKGVMGFWDFYKNWAMEHKKVGGNKNVEKI